MPGLGLRRNVVMRNALSTKGRSGIPGPVFGRIKRHKNVRKERFDARLSRFVDDGIRQFVARHHHALAQLAQSLAALSNRDLRPSWLRRARQRDRPRDDFRRRLLDEGKHLSRGRVDGRKRVDGDSGGGHNRDSNRFSPAKRAKGTVLGDAGWFVIPVLVPAVTIGRNHHYGLPTRQASSCCTATMTSPCGGTVGPALERSLLS